MTGTSKFERVKAETMDADLHRRRLAARRKPPTTMRLGEVPEGAFVMAPVITQHPLLLWRGSLWPWDQGEYSAPVEPSETRYVTKVAPRLGVRFLACGFRFDPDLMPAIRA